MNPHAPTKYRIIKRELVVKISDQTGMIQRDVRHIVQLLLDNIVEHLAASNEVVLRNFGTFEAVVRRPRTGRNPNHPEKPLPVPAMVVAKFTAGKELRECALELTPE